VLPITNGGTGLGGGTSGGILGFTASGTLASSALLSSGGLILGGGAGATPSTSPNFTTTLGANSAVLNVGASGTGSTNSGNLGALFLAGSTSGGPTLASQATGGSLILQLPSTAPSANQVLTATAVNSGTVTLGFSTPAGGTVSSIATNGPITGGTITSTGTIACPTCMTGTGLTSGQLIVSGGGQAVAVANLTGDVSTNGGTATTLAANVGGAHTFSGNVTFSNPISGSISGSAANFTGNLSGDVTGTESATIVTKINGSALGTMTGANNGQVLAWNGTAWAPATIISNGGIAGGQITITAANVNGGSLAKASCTPADPSFSFPNATNTMAIMITPAGALHAGDWDQGGITWTPYVSATGTVKVHVCNGSNGTVNFTGSQIFNLRFIN
jgi:hypothetical protein